MAAPLPSLQLLIPEEAIAEKVGLAARKLNALYAGKELTLVMVLKGALCLAADLIRRLQVPTRLEYVQGMRYGARGTEGGELTLIGLDRIDITGKEVLLVDDIYDKGETLTNIMAKLQEKKPASLKTLVLLNKKTDRKTNYLPDFSLFEIEDKFVVGYGLDYKELYRGLKGVYIL